MNATAGVDPTGKPLWLFEVGWLPDLKKENA